MGRRGSLFLLCTVLAGCAGQSPPTVAPGATPTVTAAVPRPPFAESVRDGRYVIGFDVSPGLWHTEGPRQRRGVDVAGVIAGPPPPCKWAIGWPNWKHDEPSGPVTLSLSMGETMTPTDVEVSMIGAEFVSQGCQSWHLKGPAS